MKKISVMLIWVQKYKPQMTSCDYILILNQNTIIRPLILSVGYSFFISDEHGRILTTENEVAER